MWSGISSFYITLNEYPQADYKVVSKNDDGHCIKQ